MVFCNICLESLSAEVECFPDETTTAREAVHFNKMNGVIATTCGHLFHRLCLNRWFSRTIGYRACPLCNKQVQLRRAIKVYQNWSLEETEVELINKFKSMRKSLNSSYNALKESSKKQEIEISHLKTTLSKLTIQSTEFQTYQTVKEAEICQARMQLENLKQQIEKQQTLINNFHQLYSQQLGHAVIPFKPIFINDAEHFYDNFESNINCVQSKILVLDELSRMNKAIIEELLKEFKAFKKRKVLDDIFKRQYLCACQLFSHIGNPFLHNSSTSISLFSLQESINELKLKTELKALNFSEFDFP